MVETGSSSHGSSDTDRGVCCLLKLNLGYIPLLKPVTRTMTGQVVSTTCLILTVFSTALAEDDPNWVRITLDERFRSEGVSAGDLNGDGHPDVVAGDVWYEAPAPDSKGYTDGTKWKLHEIRMPGDFVAGKGYSNSFVNNVYDMNRDGKLDVIIVGFPGDPFHWYQNPGTPDGEWKQHVIWKSICNESPEFEDLNNDGVPEYIFGSQPEAKVGFVSIPSAKKVTRQFNFNAVSEASREPEKSPRRGMDNGTFKYYHGLGVDDMNGDGHEDIIIAHGWWESPGSLTSSDKWKFHPIRVDQGGRQTPLPGCGNIYADDFDKDGDPDLFFTSAHSFGVWWSENKGEGKWVLHEIDKSFSQTHAVERVDINGDGNLDYVTGKRFFAHNGGDPGAHQDVDMYWFEVERKKDGPVFKSHRIAAGRGTGIGTQFHIFDMNKDKRPDIVLSNKKGVNVLLQK